MKEGIYMQNYSYPNIDMRRTGVSLKKKVQEAGYTVKELQEKLMLSCPQPIKPIVACPYGRIVSASNSN